MKKIMLFGGSFNPFHMGHVGLVRYIYSQAPQTKLLIIPTHLPPHKNSRELVEGHHRMEMIKLSLQQWSNWELCTYEMEKGEASYTIDTVNYLLEEGIITDKPGLIIGDDWIKGFRTWRNARDLAQMVELTVFHRNFEGEEEFDYPHIYLNNPIVDVSSTDVRDRLIQGESLKGYVHPRVEEYITEYGLYKT